MKAVLQLAVISLILLSLIVCEALRDDVGSPFLNLPRPRNAFDMSNEKVFINDLGCLSSQQS